MSYILPSNEVKFQTVTFFTSSEEIADHFIHLFSFEAIEATDFSTKSISIGKKLLSSPVLFRSLTFHAKAFSRLSNHSLNE